MCETCGCSDGARTTITNLTAGGAARAGGHDHAPVHDHVHDPARHHRHEHGHDHPHDHVHLPDGTVVELQESVLAKNDQLAARNRAWFDGREILCLNLVSSPGAGKTTLLERTIREAGARHRFHVIEGDQATANDGERIRAAGAPVVQINTGTGCHLEADMIARALGELAPPFRSVVLIENVGNLVCPALFDLGERSKVAVVSVTEGEDKALKYPHMFQAADLVLVNKIDLLPHLRFDLDACLANIRMVTPHADVLQVSATTGAGLGAWYDWIAARCAVHQALCDLPDRDGPGARRGGGEKPTA
ncbi:MAG: hydrogenase nickel incorporation protein HypB [Alphaproteobacteria bacterium]|nr:hydrogenase nickel incorporation protein HypB [Alphaproteobacteria bacterium]